MAVEQRIVRFTGQVQGVGFRGTTCRAAAGFDVTGYVRNMPDGSVHCVAEGEAKEIDAFIEDVRGRMGGHICDISEQTAAATGEFSDFGVRY